MIVFDLACRCGYEFEGWFNHWHDFAEQQAQGRIACPACGSSEIRKLMSPVASVQSGSAFAPPASAVQDNSERASLLKALHTLRQFVETNFEDVGTAFAEETLKMHYGVTEERDIRGVATSDEEKTLRNEGIEILKVPLPAGKGDKKIH